MVITHAGCNAVHNALATLATPLATKVTAVNRSRRSPENIGPHRCRDPKSPTPHLDGPTKRRRVDHGEGGDDGGVLGNVVTGQVGDECRLDEIVEEDERGERRGEDQCGRRDYLLLWAGDRVQARHQYDIPSDQEEPGKVGECLHGVVVAGERLRALPGRLGVGLF